jgi:SAM-dependent methyltransferase
MDKIPWTWGCKIIDQFRRDLLEEQAHRFTGRVLDLGCGKKPYRQMLGRRAAAWIGIDLPLTYSGPAPADVYADGHWLPFKDGIFDVILSTDVLEHVQEPKQIFVEAARVLRPGGLLIMTAPQTAHLHEEPHDYFRFTKYGLAYLVQATGLGIVEIKAFGGALALVGQTIACHIPVLFRGRVGEWLRGVGQAMAQWLFWHADKALHLVHDGAEESTIAYLLVARKDGPPVVDAMDLPSPDREWQERT